MPPVRKATSVQESAPFGDIDFLRAGGGQFDMPEGDYGVEFAVANHQYPKKDGTLGEPMVGLMLTCYPMKNRVLVDGAEPIPRFINFGKGMYDKWVPNAEGTGVVKRAGVENADPPTRKGNYGIFLESLYNCGMPKGTLSNDFSVLNGIGVTIVNILEPEERKTFKGSDTAEVQEEKKNNQPNKIPVVSAILDDCKPWEGTSAFPVEGEAKKPAKATAKKAAVVVAEPEEEGEADDVDELAAIAGMVIPNLVKKAGGSMTKLKFRIEVFKAIEKESDNETASKVKTVFFEDDAALNGLLKDMNLQVKNGMIAAI